MREVLRTVYQCLPPPTFPGCDLPCGGGGPEFVASELPQSVRWENDTEVSAAAVKCTTSIQDLAISEDPTPTISLGDPTITPGSINDGHTKEPSSVVHEGPDRISFLPEGLRQNIIRRLPNRDAIMTRLLSHQWYWDWRSFRLYLDDEHTKEASSMGSRHGGPDRISFLPECLRRNIIGRLPTKDAVRTKVLSRQWCRDWRSTPLHLDDVDLLRSEEDKRIQRVSRILLEHPGPFGYVRLIHTCFDHRPAALTLWLDILASKVVEELVLVNQPPPVDMALPISIMRCSHLKRLHLGFFYFPSTSGRIFLFRELKELGLYCVTITSRDLSSILCSSPILQTLSIVSSYGTECISVRGHVTLRCLVIWSSVVKDISMQNSESMERVILWNTMNSDSRMNIMIGDVPNLKVLGYLDPGAHNLVVGHTVIQFGTKASSRTMIPSVKVLGLRVLFEDKRQSRLLPAFLKCFPNVDTLHIESTKTREPNGKFSLVSWQNMCGDIACLDNHTKKIFVHNFRGQMNELAFLKFLLENARVLEVIVIILSAECLTQIDCVWDQLGNLGCSDRASEKARLLVTDCSSPLSYEMSLDLSTRDPFCSTDDLIEQLQQQVDVVTNDVEEAVMLSSGHMMPVVRLAMWQMVAKMDTLLDSGYRHFDCTSDFYNQMCIGKALTEACRTQGVKREDMFVTIELPYNNPDNVIESCKHTLRNLQLDYLDLYLVTVPDLGVGDSDTTITLEKTWKAMEELVSMGLVNSIGISNCDIFLTRDVLAYSKIKPAVSEIEIHPYLQRDALVKFCQTHEMCVMVQPYDCLEPFLEDSIIKDLAKKYGKTPASVVLRWGLQRGLIVAIDVLECLFDFNISAEDMKAIMSLDRASSTSSSVLS